jgi:hypothetical protein
VEEKQRLFKLYHVAEVISGAGPSRLLLYKKSENRGDNGGRPVDEALQEVWRGWRLEAAGFWRFLKPSPTSTAVHQYSRHS